MYEFVWGRKRNTRNESVTTSLLMSYVLHTYIYAKIITSFYIMNEKCCDKCIAYLAQSKVFLKIGPYLCFSL